MTKNNDGARNKTRVPCRRVTEGPSRAPDHFYHYAMGLGTREIAQPLVSVASGMFTPISNRAGTQAPA